MKKLLFLFAIPFLILACQSAEKAGNEITTLEKKVKEAGTKATDEDITTLLSAYDDYITNHPEDKEWNSRYMYRAAALSYKKQKYTKSLKYVERAAREYPNAETTPNNLLLYATILKDNYRNLDRSQAMFQALLEKYPTHAIAEDVKKSLVENKSLNKRITELKGYVDTTTQRLDLNLANAVVGAYEAAALVFPEGENTAEYLYEAGRLSRIANRNQDALKFWSQLAEQYPKYEKTPEALFLTGFIYENNFNSLEKAKTAYTLFLERYPENKAYKDDAEFSLKNLGKTPDEIVKEFDKNKK